MGAPADTIEQDRRTGTRRIMIVDDHHTFADLLSLALATRAGLVCVGTAASGSQALAMAVELRPDIVVMDIEMPSLDGLATTRRLREILPEVLVVVVSAHRDAEWVVRATQAGAAAFVPKASRLDEVIDIIQRARPGGMLVGPSAFAAGNSSLPPTPGDVPVPALTEREREVLAWLGQGLQPKEIAQLLDITVHTTRSYVKALHAKLGVRSQVEAVVKAHQLRLIDLSGPVGG